MTDKKGKFRSKKLDYNRLLNVYRYHEIVDVTEDELSSRAVPIIATGVDKEEEDEHHLQAAISSSLASKKMVSIPTPQASSLIDESKNIYPLDFERPDELIRFSSIGDDALEEVSLMYFGTEEDAAFIKNLSIDMDKFEEILTKFQQIAENEGFDAVSETLLLEFDDVPLNSMKKVLDYWKQKRIKFQGHVAPYMKHVDISKEVDPFVCFRKRQVKVNQRKTRRTDSQSLEKLKKLRQDLDITKQLFEMINRRDLLKKEALELDGQIFERGYALEVQNTSSTVAAKSTSNVLKAMRGSWVSDRLRRKSRMDSLLPYSKNESNYITSRPAPLLEQYPNPEELLRTEFNRSQYAKDLFKRIRVELEKRISLDRQFDEVRQEVDNFVLDGKGKVGYRSRIGRGGRLIIDRKLLSPDLDDEKNLVFDHQAGRRFLSGRDLASLNNTKVHNYNQHYLQCTNQLKKQQINYTSMITTPTPRRRKKRPE